MGEVRSASNCSDKLLDFEALMYSFVVFMDSGEKALRDELFKNYSNAIRPVKDLSKTMYVNITLTIMQIVRLDEQNQVMTTSVQIKLVKYC